MNFVYFALHKRYVLVFQPKANCWIKMRSNNPELRVHFEIESTKPIDIVTPNDLSTERSAIPCHSIVMDNPNIKVADTDLDD